MTMMRSTLIFSAVLFVLVCPWLVRASTTCDLVDCTGSLALLGASSIGASTAVATPANYAPAVSVAAPPFNTMSPASMPGAPAAPFSDPVSTSAYFSLPAVKGIQIGALQSLPSSSSEIFNPMANQPNAPFNDPVKDSSYFAPPATNTSTAATSTSGSSVTTGIGAIP